MINRECHCGKKGELWKSASSEKAAAMESRRSKKIALLIKQLLWKTTYFEEVALLKKWLHWKNLMMWRSTCSQKVALL